MDNEIKVWLYDILNAINEIEHFLSGDANTFTYYQSDLKTRRAVERNIEIIGEAMNRILQRDQNTPITSARKIVDLRNRIIHGYDSVSDQTVWSIIQNHMPGLKMQIEELLGE